VCTLYFRSGELHATAAHHRAERDGMVMFAFCSPCLEHSKEHQLVRSGLDPGYGRNSHYYPDDGGA
jgi:hypothetical protein